MLWIIVYIIFACVTLMTGFALNLSPFLVALTLVAQAALCVHAAWKEL